VSKYFNEEKMKIAPLLRQWAREGLERGAEWMIILKPTSGEIFPLYVGDGRTPRQTFFQYLQINGNSFDPVECYDFTKNIEDQISQDNNQNWDRGLPVERGNFSLVTPWPK